MRVNTGYFYERENEVYFSPRDILKPDVLIGVYLTEREANKIAKRLNRESNKSWEEVSQQKADKTPIDEPSMIAVPKNDNSILENLAVHAWKDFLANRNHSYSAKSLAHYAVEYARALIDELNEAQE